MECRIGLEQKPQPYAFSLVSLRFSHTIFIDLIAVDLGALGKRAIGIEVIPLAVDLQPFPGNHDTVFGEVVGFVVTIGA